MNGCLKARPILAERRVFAYVIERRNTFGMAGNVVFESSYSCVIGLVCLSNAIPKASGNANRWSVVSQ